VAALPPLLELDPLDELAQPIVVAIIPRPPSHATTCIASRKRFLLVLGSVFCIGMKPATAMVVPTRTKSLWF
jgi:hypothetical protein